MEIEFDDIRLDDLIEKIENIGQEMEVDSSVITFLIRQAAVFYEVKQEDQEEIVRLFFNNFFRFNGQGHSVDLESIFWDVMKSFNRKHRCCEEQDILKSVDEEDDNILHQSVEEACKKHLKRSDYSDVVWDVVVCQVFASGDLNPESIQKIASDYRELSDFSAEEFDLSLANQADNLLYGAAEEACKKHLKRSDYSNFTWNVIVAKVFASGDLNSESIQEIANKYRDLSNFSQKELELALADCKARIEEKH